MSTLTIAQIVQTCPECPSQWEGRLTDGRPFYIRYRWGCLTVSFGEVGAAIESAVDAEDWFCEQIGDEYDGLITIEGVCNYTGLRIASS